MLCQPVPSLRLVSSIGRGSSMVLFPLLHFRLFCAKYTTQMDAKETHSPRKNFWIFPLFCSVYPFCIHFCGIVKEMASPMGVPWIFPWQTPVWRKREGEKA